MDLTESQIHVRVQASAASARMSPHTSRAEAEPEDLVRALRDGRQRRPAVREEPGPVAQRTPGLRVPEECPLLGWASPGSGPTEKGFPCICDAAWGKGSFLGLPRKVMDLLTGVAPGGRSPRRSPGGSAIIRETQRNCDPGSLRELHIHSAHFGCGLASEVKVDELDASYCFMAGHCDPDGPVVANNATVEDGIALCDAKFGRKTWTTFGAAHLIIAYTIFPQALRVAFLGPCSGVDSWGRPRAQKERVEF